MLRREFTGSSGPCPSGFPRHTWLALSSRAALEDHNRVLTAPLLAAFKSTEDGRRRVRRLKTSKYLSPVFAKLDSGSFCLAGLQNK